MSSPKITGTTTITIQAQGPILTGSISSTKSQCGGRVWSFTEIGRLVTAWFTEPPTIDVRTSYWKRTQYRYAGSGAEMEHLLWTEMWLVLRQWLWHSVSRLPRCTPFIEFASCALRSASLHWHAASTRTHGAGAFAGGALTSLGNSAHGGGGWLDRNFLAHWPV